MADRDEAVIAQPVVEQIAAAHDRTPAQILLRWGVQRGTAVVPKTSRSDRLKENLALFDFELSAQEMSLIDSLDRHRRFNDPGDFAEAGFNTFFPIYD
jgi:D-xylose reductase